MLRSTPETKLTVVVVDDDSATRDSFRALLGSAGFHVESFSTGPHFLRSIATIKAHCALVDVQMPQPDGLFVLDEIVAIGARIPIILMTSQPKSMSLAEARARGAVMVLEKPIDDARLLSAIDEAVCRSH